MQQKQELWKMSLSATSRSMGYTVFWQEAQVSFTWARRLKDCCRERLSQGPGQHPLPPPTHPHRLPWSAEQSCRHHCLWLPGGEGQSGQGQPSDAPDHGCGHQPRSQGGVKGGRQTCRALSLHPQARLLPRSPPTSWITYMRGSGLGCSSSLEHGSWR